MKKLLMLFVFMLMPLMATAAVTLPAGLTSVFGRMIVATNLSAEVDVDKAPGEVALIGRRPEAGVLVALPLGGTWGLTSEFKFQAEKPGLLQFSDVGVRVGVGIVLVK